MQQVLGVDFDNTVASYGDLLHRLALQSGWIAPEVRKDKNEIRDRVRQLKDGEIQWQKLQGAAYGPQIGQATLVDGVLAFFKACTERGCKAYIISHKTRYAAYDETRTNLRQAAVAWMTGHRFFEPDGLGLKPTDVFFEASRQEKLERIRSLGCTLFIDDLAETFLEDTFPPGVEKILYNPSGAESNLSGVKTVRTWWEIADRVFNPVH